MKDWLRNRFLKFTFKFCFIQLFILSTACTRPPRPLLGLVETSSLGQTRTFHWRRVLTHFHSPYSYDACDDQGLIGWEVNPACLKDVREAVCVDREDVVFATDHPNNMARYAYEKLLMHQEQDEWILSATGKKIGNRIHCPDGFKVDWYPGFEGRLIALGVERHASENQDERIRLYQGDDPKSILEIETKTGALMVVPHTESRSLEFLERIRPSAIEIYNFHAYMDPKIRKRDLGLSPISHFASLIKYFIDPFQWYDANYLFADIYELSPVYFKKWDALQAKGISATGLGGADSHETIFKMKMSDGERLDHHRRMIRFFSNLILTEKNDETSMKDAIKKGRSYFVAEQFGTPEGLDFFLRSDAENAAVLAEMGDRIKVKNGQSLVFHLPSVFPDAQLNSASPKPMIWADLIRVNEKAEEEVVKTETASSELIYQNPGAGHYRIHVWIKPRHLSEHFSNRELGEKPFLWVISNPIEVW